MEPETNFLAIDQDEIFDFVPDSKTSLRVKENIDDQKIIKTPTKHTVPVSPRKSPRKSIQLLSPVKLQQLDASPRKSPRKINLDIDPKDVITVVKNIYNSSKSFSTEDSGYPLHQKLLICVMLLILKKGKNKNVNIGQVCQFRTH